MPDPRRGSADNSSYARPSASPARQHHWRLRAARPRDPPDLRIAQVRVRLKDPDKLLPNVKAEDIGFESGIYDVKNPTTDLQADYAEGLDWPGPAYSTQAELVRLCADQGRGITGAARAGTTGPALRPRSALEEPLTAERSAP